MDKNQSDVENKEIQSNTTCWLSIEWWSSPPIYTLPTYIFRTHIIACFPPFFTNIYTNTWNPLSNIYALSGFVNQAKWRIFFFFPAESISNRRLKWLWSAKIVLPMSHRSIIAMLRIKYSFIIFF